MSEPKPSEDHSEILAALREHAEGLERKLQEAETLAAMQVRHAELKAEAVRVGIVDIDGLRLLSAEAFAAPKEGTVMDPSEVIARLRRDKPWLFTNHQSSSAASPPAAAPVRRRLATDMSLEEWRVARADLLRRR